jgi:DNA-binding MarR family transcriptional regulator
MTVSLQKVAEIMEFWRSVHPELPPQTALTYLYVAMHPRATQVALMQGVGLERSSVSRNCYSLMDEKKPGQRGLGLIYEEDGRLDRRVKEYSLTAKGEACLKNLQAILTKR